MGWRDRSWEVLFPASPSIYVCFLLSMCLHVSNHQGIFETVSCCINRKVGMFGQALCNNAAVDPAGNDTVMRMGINCLTTCLGSTYCSTFNFDSDGCSLGYATIPDCYSYVIAIVQPPLLPSSNFSGCRANIALHQPACQSSTYWGNSVERPASAAVDGGYSTNALYGACSITADGVGGPNWWTVDLGQPVFIDHVRLLNRFNFESRLNYFIVGITNDSPLVHAPIRGGYPLCGQYPFPSPAAAWMTVNCMDAAPSGQFVIVQQPANGDGFLTICECEVYPRCA